jgi:hypothetical protein
MCSDPQHVFGWRYQARKDVAVPRHVLASGEGPSFVPIVTEAAAEVATAGKARVGSSIEIELAGIVVRVVSGVDGVLLTAVLRAVRCTSGVP